MQPKLINKSKIKFNSKNVIGKQIEFKKLNFNSRTGDKVNKLILNFSQNRGDGTFDSLRQVMGARDGDNVRSVKRSNGENRDRNVNSPYVDAREFPNAVNIKKIRRSRVLKNAETELLHKQTENDSKEQMEQNNVRNIKQIKPIADKNPYSQVNFIR
jgi:hypothetical protein